MERARFRAGFWLSVFAEDQTRFFATRLSEVECGEKTVSEGRAIEHWAKIFPRDERRNPLHGRGTRRIDQGLSPGRFRFTQDRAGFETV